MSSKRHQLAIVAEEEALRPFHGKMMGLPSNIRELTRHFPDGPRKEFEGKWCAAFVYHCCTKAGFMLPYRYPSVEFGTFAGVRAWVQWAKLKENRFYFSARNRIFIPKPGDIVVYDRLFDPGPHDHMGIVLAVRRKSLRVAEGNVNDLSAVLTRERNSHIRGFIRIPDDYKHPGLG